jgi:NADH dehydrogenase
MTSETISPDTTTPAPASTPVLETAPKKYGWPHRVVVVGGGFGGLNASRKLNKAQISVTLIDQRNFHLFQPLLYQVATGALSPANIAAPLRGILSRQKNCQILMDKVLDIDPVNRIIKLEDGEVEYDSLILAAGAGHSYFGHNEWEKNAPGLKTVEDATDIRRRIFTAFEKAEKETNLEIRNSLLNFVIVGGGPTGVELAGALGEISRQSLKYDFRHIDPSKAKILLVEAADRILMQFPDDLAQSAAKTLEKLGVEIRTSTMVTDIQAAHVKLKHGETEEILPTSTVIWAAGVQASPLAKKIAAATGCQQDRAGRLIVNEDMLVPGTENIYVIGDMAHYALPDGKPLPGVAPVAMQMGVFVAQHIVARINHRTLPKFKYHNYGNMATIGKASAVADFGWWKPTGMIAWLLWLVVHLMHIVQFRNRLLVIFQWAWNYLTFDRSARLITINNKPENIS